MMKLNYLKGLFNLLILLSLASCNKLKPNTFILNGTIKGNYSGFIYLNYDSKEDSCLVSNNKFRFKGTILSTTSARLGTKRRTSAMEKDFYLEESEIIINIEIQQKKIRETELDWIIINSTKGSKIADLQNEFESYTLKFKLSKIYQRINYLFKVFFFPLTQFKFYIMQSIITISTINIIIIINSISISISISIPFKLQNFKIKIQTIFTTSIFISI